MARGPRASPAETPLPKPSFQKVEDEGPTHPAGVHDLQARSYGYSDLSDFRRPEHYIRHIEPLESELAVQVEYDMDEQDQEWLDAINLERKKEQINKVSYEVFEIVMDRLEKEWFDLTKNIPKPDLAMPSEDSTCAICDDSEGENSNAIVFCDGCNLAVHQDCYGVPYIPEGQWLCRKCTVSPEIPVSCILCPNEGGAFKQTVHGEWVHLLCAIWVPETRVANDVFMEPVTGVEKISKQRWKLKCSICDIREGACIQCAKTSCFLAFHATCARKEKLLMPMKSTPGAEPVTLTCFCDKHLSKEQQEVRAAALAAEEAMNVHDHSGVDGKSSKAARAYAKTYNSGPPLVPALVVERILHYIGKVAIRKKHEFVLMMCRYWSLKREARRGAPLLKRLHLEPWTASAGGKILSEEEKGMKLELLQRLRRDLESVRSLAELSRKRESRKLRQAETIQDILTTFLFAHEAPLRLAFEKITGLDRQGFFKNPVSKAEVPDYFDIVKHPMCWNVIDSKLDRHEYWDLQDFKDDINLVLDNAILYNKSGTPFYKAAVRIRASSQPILADLNRLSLSSPVPEVKPSPESETATTPPEAFAIGDMEPPLDILELLVSTEAVRDDINIILTANPLVSLFNYELGQPKPPPPPPPPPPKVSKHKRDRRLEYEKRRLEKKAQNEALAAEALLSLDTVMLDSSPGFRTPRTRRAHAAAAAFEAEARGGPPVEAVLVEAKDVAEAAPVTVEPPTSSATPEAEKKPGSKKKRALPALLGRNVVPPMVDDVDSQRSFKMFDAGWILPSGQRRGGRAAVERQAVPPPKKRMRTDAGTSRLSVFSTAASENQTLQETPPLQSAQTNQETLSSDVQMFTEPTIDAMDIDAAPLAVAEDGNIITPLDVGASESQEITVSSTSVNSISEDMSIPPPNIIRTANGTAVIEELDTPAIRRQKNQRRKAERARAAEAAAVTAASQASSIAGGSRTANGEGVTDEDETLEAESELSDLSDTASDAAGEDSSLDGPSPRSSARRSSTSGSKNAGLRDPPVEAEAGAIILEPGKKLEGGTLVWAKADTYPWWPAVVFEEDDPNVPPSVLKAGSNPDKKKKGVQHLIRFYDHNSSWAWLGLERLMLLGESNALDLELLATTSKKQKWKNVTARKDCQAAYKRAIAEMETPSDAAAAPVDAEGASGSGGEAASTDG